MTGYIGRRLLGIGINLIAVSILVFLLLRVVPGDIAGAILGIDADPERAAAWKEQHGLNDPIPIQYLNWAGNLVTGDFGTSFNSRVSVSKEFLRKLPITLEIVFLSFFVTTTIGIVGGVISATRQNSLPDYSFRIFAILGISIPNFLLLTLLLIIPARLFSYSPPFGATSLLDDPLRNLELFLPATVLLAIGSSAGLMRLTRSTFLEVMRQDYLRTARAKGLSERVVIYRHAFRNAIPPVMTLAGIQLGTLLGGTIIVEQIMSLPGLGAWTLTAIQFKDYPVVMAVTLYSAVMIMFISLVVDLCYAWMDPRIRLS